MKMNDAQYDSNATNCSYKNKIYEKYDFLRVLRILIESEPKKYILKNILFCHIFICQLASKKLNFFAQITKRDIQKDAKSQNFQSRDPGFQTLTGII